MARIRSMTGFGSASCEIDAHHLDYEVRSVNHRYLKIQSSVPDEISWAQSIVDSSVRSRFGRGSISVTISLRSDAGDTQLEVDEDWLRELHEQVSRMRKSLGDETPLRVTELLGIEGVLRRKDPLPGTREVLEPAFCAGLEEALEQLASMQEREGQILVEELQGILRQLTSGIEFVEEKVSEHAAEVRDRYVARVRDLVEASGHGVSDEDLAREVAILGEKSDISEEIGRLKGHAIQFGEALETGGKVGRKLDFLTQEMFRESNTMAAKSSIFELSSAVLEMKAQVDRLREQVQNIE